MRRALFLFPLMVMAGSSFGQQFRGSASLPEVEADGFYSVTVSPDISLHLNGALTDIRIYDQHHMEVPYLIRKEDAVYTTQQFREYVIRSKNQENGCCTSLILHNPDRRPINNISLLIRNAEVTKEATLMGSDDEQQWYALKQKFRLHAINNPGGTSEIKIVDFPLSNYTYYLLRVDDSVSAPLNILKAGFYDQHTETGTYTEIPSFHIQSADSSGQKKTYVKLTFDTGRLVDKLDLTVEGAPFYHRKAVLYDKRIRVTKKGNNEKYYHRLLDFEVNSTQSTTLWLPGIKTEELLIVVENKDNPPLLFVRGKAFQLNRYLVAWLSKDNIYTLMLGNDHLKAPAYDIAYFKDSIPDHMNVLRVGGVVMAASQKKEEGTVTVFARRQIIWVAIIVVIGVLAFMSIKLIHETGQNTKKE